MLLWLLRQQEMLPVVDSPPITADRRGSVFLLALRRHFVFSIAVERLSFAWLRWAALKLSWISIWGEEPSARSLH